MAGNLKDFATGIVVTPPSPATTGTTLTLQTGEGARMPAVPFSATAHPVTEMPTLDNAEKILVTNVTGDVLTIVRAQGDTTAKSIAVTWRVSNTLFATDVAKALSDLTDDATHRIVSDTEKTGWNAKVTAPAINADGYIPQWDGENSKTLKGGIPTSTFATALGTDDNYVTDAEKTKLSNLSGINTGDNLIIGTSAPTPSVGAQVLWLDTTGGNVTLNLITGE